MRTGFHVAVHSHPRLDHQLQLRHLLYLQTFQSYASGESSLTCQKPELASRMEKTLALGIRVIISMAECPDNISLCTVQQLKDFLREHNINLSGIKPELVSKVTDIIATDSIMREL